MFPSYITPFFVGVPFSTSFSCPRTTRSVSSAGYSRWRTAWSSGGPKSCLGHSPRMSWPSSRRRSQPKSIMGTGKPGLTSWRSWTEMDTFMLSTQLTPSFLPGRCTRVMLTALFLPWKTSNSVDKKIGWCPSWARPCAGPLISGRWWRGGEGAQFLVIDWTGLKAMFLDRLSLYFNIGFYISVRLNLSPSSRNQKCNANQICQVLACFCQLKHVFSLLIVTPIRSKELITFLFIWLAQADM